MKITVEVDQSKWKEVAEAHVKPTGQTLSIYKHEEYIYHILYDWDTGNHTVIRPCGSVVCCVQDLMIAQTIAQLIATNRP